MYVVALPGNHPLVVSTTVGGVVVAVLCLVLCAVLLKGNPTSSQKAGAAVLAVVGIAALFITGVISSWLLSISGYGP